MQKPYTITLDLYSNGSKSTAINYVVSDSETMPLYIALTEKGKPFVIPQNAQIELNFRNAKGDTFPRYGGILDYETGRITYEIDSADIAIAGQMTATISLVYGGQRLTWPCFMFNVTRSFAGGAIPPEAEAPWFTQVMQMISTINERLDELEAGGGGGEGGTTYHDKLKNLAFDVSGHIGFASAAQVSAINNELTAINNRINALILNDSALADEILALQESLNNIQLIPGEDGTDGFSPIITVKTKTPTEYILTITDKNGSFDTPNLQGQNSGGTGNISATFFYNDDLPTGTNAISQNEAVYKWIPDDSISQIKTNDTVVSRNGNLFTVTSVINNSVKVSYNMYLGSNYALKSELPEANFTNEEKRKLDLSINEYLLSIVGGKYRFMLETPNINISSNDKVSVVFNEANINGENIIVYDTVDYPIKIGNRNVITGEISIGERATLIIYNGVAYISNIDNDYANNQEALDGENTWKIMTPKTTSDAINNKMSKDLSEYLKTIDADNKYATKDQGKKADISQKHYSLNYNGSTQNSYTLTGIGDDFNPTITPILVCTVSSFNHNSETKLNILSDVYSLYISGQLIRDRAFSGGDSCTIILEPITKKAFVVGLNYPFSNDAEANDGSYKNVMMNPFQTARMITSHNNGIQSHPNKLNKSEFENFVLNASVQPTAILYFSGGNGTANPILSETEPTVNQAYTTLISTTMTERNIITYTFVDSGIISNLSSWEIPLKVINLTQNMGYIINAYLEHVRGTTVTPLSEIVGYTFSTSQSETTKSFSIPFIENALLKNINRQAGDILRCRISWQKTNSGQITANIISNVNNPSALVRNGGEVSSALVTDNNGIDVMPLSYRLREHDNEIITLSGDINNLNNKLNMKADKTDFWRGTQAEYDALTPMQQNALFLAVIV